MQGSSITFFDKAAGALNPLAETELASLYLFDDDNWLVTTPKGFFEGSPGAWKHVRWRFNNNTFDYVPVELYFKEFYYPNLLQSVLNGKSPKPPAGREMEKVDRRQPSVLIAEINGRSNTGLDTQPASQLQTEKRMATVTITVADNPDEPKQPDHTASSGAQDLRLFRNGSLVRVWRDDLFDWGRKTAASSSRQENRASRAGCVVALRCRLWKARINSPPTPLTA